ncbi:receptor-like protein 9DC3 [Gossypium hirsutum]|uniref:Receptor-like protein 9DC3 n=1 Tax=Gossypium hirsutum TaxID=3635 RepID=A0ABM3AFA7_GOSHI|nr:receptor-like protein 9DC3 [Gossypium hirsutum]
MRILLLSWLLFNSYFAAFFCISNLVLVSGRCQSDQKQLLLELNLSSNLNSTAFPTPLRRLMKWNQTTDCCSWDGVSCDAGGHVIGLDLSDRAISSPIDNSSSLFRLQHLQQLNLAFNRFEQVFPAGFDKLENLSYLNLSYAGFTGQIPIEISHLTRLVTLDLSIDRYSSPEESLKLEKPNLKMLAQNLTGLRFLYLDGINMSTTGNKWSQALSPLIKLQAFWSSTIPPTLFGIPSVQALDLSQNQFNGTIGGLHVKASSLLDTLDLRSNKLQGQFPMFVFKLHGLTLLDLSSNNFSGLIPMSAFQNLRNLSYLDLSYNRLSIDAITTNISSLCLPKLTKLFLASCNLMEFPNFLKNQSSLIQLDLSNNQIVGARGSNKRENKSTEHEARLIRMKLKRNLAVTASICAAACHQAACTSTTKCNSSMVGQFPIQIHGEMPSWIWKTVYWGLLNLSGNFLVEFERPLNNIKSSFIGLDLRGNQLEGQIPILPLGVIYLDFSNNKFNSVLPAHIGDSLRYASFVSISNNNIHGSIPPSLCNITYPRVLDLSNNSLSGPIPQCLFQMNVPNTVLNLRQNNLSGIISDTFSKSCELQILDLNQNRLEGKVPKSLENCKRMEVLDIGNNQINDSFPCHLKNIATLHVLILRSNKFNGHIDCPGNSSGWPMLQIFDLASNNFSGKLHLTCLGIWEAMQLNPDKDQSELVYIIIATYLNDVLRYEDTISVTIKSLELKLVKILPEFTSIDISCNNFEGPIPNVIGTFKALYALNFSQNAFSGPIPAFFGNLRQLGSVDLSSNSLHGEIPLQLANLNFLSFLNVSNNKLVGPTSTQLQSFSEASFENNAGLCGPPLMATCGLPPAKTDNPPDARSTVNWNYISAETGFCFGFGISITLLIFWKRWRKWYFERMDRALSWVFPCLPLETRKHGRRATRNQRRH